MEKISVIVPIYNSEAFLEKCLNSILNQTYPNIEIILVNDGSADNSGLICKSYQSKYDNIKYFEVDENRGVSHARNIGLKYATGSLIGFVDSDDWIDEDMYKSLYETLTTHNAPMVSANFKLIDYETQKEINYTPPHRSDLYIDNTLDALLYTIGLRDCMLCNKLFRREIFEGIIFPEGKAYEDVEAMYLLVENAGHMAASIKRPYNYYLQPESITRNKKIPIRFLDHLDAAVKRYEYLTKKYSSNELEQLCRQHIFRTLTHIVDKLNHIDVENDERVSGEFIKAKNLVYSNYSYENCRFTDAEKKLVAALERNIKHYKISRDLLGYSM